MKAIKSHHVSSGTHDKSSYVSNFTNLEEVSVAIFVAQRGLQPASGQTLPVSDLARVLLDGLTRLIRVELPVFFILGGGERIDLNWRTYTCIAKGADRQNRRL